MIHNIGITRSAPPQLRTACRILSDRIGAPLLLGVESRENIEAISIGTAYGARGDRDYEAAAPLVQKAISDAGAKWPAGVIYEKPVLRVVCSDASDGKQEAEPVQATPKKRRKKKKETFVNQENEENSDNDTELL